MESASGIEPAALKSNVQWGPILAGVSITTATGLVLLTFGATLGLTVTSPYEGEGLSPVAFVLAAGLYLLWVQVMSFYMGGYVAARLRARAPGASEHEVDVRDGLHGLIVWGVSVIVAAFIAFVGVGGIGATSLAADTETASAVASVVEDQVNEAVAQETVATAPQDATRAERRAEVARKLSVISGFITAASLLVGAMAAFFGAHSGGNHRDKDVRWDFFTSRARVIQKVKGE